MGRKIPLDILVDSKTVFNTITKGATTLEKRLQIDASAIQQSHKTGEIRMMGWIPGSSNPADGLTRENILSEIAPIAQASNKTIH